MKIKHSPQKLAPSLFLIALLIESLACGASSNAMIPTTDPNGFQTAIISTAQQAELLTITAVGPTNIMIPTITLIPTNSPAPTSSPAPVFSITPTETSVPTSEPTEFTILTTGASIQIIDVNKRAEYVDIKNIGGQPQDLSGWLLVSERGNQTCELGGVILPGSTLRVWAGNPSGEGYNCGFNGNIWNNEELDPAVLYDNHGQEISRYP